MFVSKAKCKCFSEEKILTWPMLDPLGLKLINFLLNFPTREEIGKEKRHRFENLKRDFKVCHWDKVKFPISRSKLAQSLFHSTSKLKPTQPDATRRNPTQPDATRRNPTRRRSEIFPGISSSVIFFSWNRLSDEIEFQDQSDLILPSTWRRESSSLNLTPSRAKKCRLIIKERASLAVGITRCDFTKWSFCAMSRFASVNIFLPDSKRCRLMRVGRFLCAFASKSETLRRAFPDFFARNVRNRKIEWRHWAGLGQEALAYPDPVPVSLRHRRSWTDARTF